MPEIKKGKRINLVHCHVRNMYVKNSFMTFSIFPNILTNIFLTVSQMINM